jgi:hypothetical protein
MKLKRQKSSLLPLVSRPDSTVAVYLDLLPGLHQHKSFPTILVKICLAVNLCYGRLMAAIITNISRAPRVATAPLVPGRSVHLIDIENLCGESRPTRNQVEVARQRYMEVGLCQLGDHVIVASSRGNWMNSAYGWPGARCLVRDGKDGADLCLAEVMSTEGLSERFARAVVASGDGGLAPFVSELAAKGMDTVVVSQSSRLSRLMRMAAHKCIVLTPELEDIA